MIDRLQDAAAQNKGSGAKDKKVDAAGQSKNQKLQKVSKESKKKEGLINGEEDPILDSLT